MLHFINPKEYILIICFQVCITYTELSMKVQPLSWAAKWQFTCYWQLHNS